MANYDVLIVGGGAIGLSVARELHRLGLRRIAVLERGQIGREASLAAAGMLAPNGENEQIDDFYRFCDGSRKMYPEFAGELLAETGIDIQLDQTGALFAAFTEEDSEDLAVRFSRQTAAGIPVEALSHPETLKAEPSLSKNVRSSLYFPNDWQVENQRLLLALTRYANKHDIALIEETEVDSVVLEGTAVHGVTTSNGQLSAGSTVLAAGAWTSQIAINNAQVPFSVKPIRGQIISFAPRERLFRHVIYSHRGYLVPRADGRVLIGATEEDVGFDHRATHEAEVQLINAANEFAPILGGLPIAETWTGFRPFAEGGHPIIGEVPGYKGLYAATGHYRNGILLTPITARMLAQKIVGSSDESLWEHFGAVVTPLVEKNAAA